MFLENEDETNFFFFHDIPAGRAGEVINRYVDVLADAGVTTILWNTNARRTNYRSDVWPAYWDGYDPAGPDDQPFLAPVPLEQRARNGGSSPATCSRCIGRGSTSRPGDRALSATRHVPLDHVADE